MISKKSLLPLDLKNQTLREIFKYLPEENCIIFLFGSQAEKKATRRSDIDIEVHCLENIDAKKFLALQEALNINVDTLRKIDIVDFKRVSGKFKDFALKEIEIWHVRKNLRKRFLTLERLIQNLKT